MKDHTNSGEVAASILALPDAFHTQAIAQINTTMAKEYAKDMRREAPYDSKRTPSRKNGKKPKPHLRQSIRHANATRAQPSFKRKRAINKRYGVNVRIDPKRDRMVVIERAYWYRFAITGTWKKSPPNDFISRADDALHRKAPRIIDRVVQRISKRISRDYKALSKLDRKRLSYL